MRKAAALVICLLFILGAAGCGGNLTGKDRIISLYRKNESAFIAAAASGDTAAVKKLRGIREVSPRGDGEHKEIEFSCGGIGLVPSASYYGILYVENGEAVFSQLCDSSPEWSYDGEGYHYRQADGDNDFTYEPLGNDFFYYEEHF